MRGWHQPSPNVRALEITVEGADCAQNKRGCVSEVWGVLVDGSMVSEGLTLVNSFRLGCDLRSVESIEIKRGECFGKTRYRMLG